MTDLPAIAIYLLGIGGLVIGGGLRWQGTTMGWKMAGRFLWVLALLIEIISASVLAAHVSPRGALLFFGGLLLTSLVIVRLVLSLRDSARTTGRGTRGSRYRDR